MKNGMNEQITAEVYEPPVLAELGEFSEDTLGGGFLAPESFSEMEND